MGIPLYTPGVSGPYVTIEGAVSPSTAFAAECADVVARIRAKADWGIARILSIADLHSNPPLDNDRRQMLYSVVRLARDLRVDAIVINGDVLAGATGDAAAQKALLAEIVAILADAGCPVLITHGNHDDNSHIESGNTAPTPENVVLNADWRWITVDTCCAESRRYVIPAGSNGYYALYDHDKRLVYMVLNSSDLTDAERLATGGQNWHKLSAEQLAWIDETLSGLGEGWQAICCCHVTAMPGMAHNLGLENRADLYALLEKHADKIIAYLCGHGHMSCNYKDPTTGICFVMTPTCGGVIVDASVSAPAGFGYSNPSKAAKDAAATGAMVADIITIHHDGTVTTERFGAEDDVFRDAETAE